MNLTDMLRGFERSRDNADNSLLGVKEMDGNEKPSGTVAFDREDFLSVLAVLGLSPEKGLDFEAIRRTSGRSEAAVAAVMPLLLDTGLARNEGFGSTGYKVYTPRKGIVADLLLRGRDNGSVALLMDIAGHDGKMVNVTRHPGAFGQDRLHREGLIGLEWDTSIGDEYFASITEKGRKAVLVLSMFGARGPGLEREADEGAEAGLSRGM